MVTKRIYELAKEMGLASRDVLATAQDLGLPVTTASSGLDPGDAEALRSMLLPEEPEEDIADAEDAPDLPEEDSPPEVEESEPDIEVIVVPAGVSVLEMARAMRQPVGEVVKQLLSMGLMAAAAAPVPPDAIEPLGEHFGIMVEVEQGAEPEEADEPLVKPKRVFDDDPASLVGRPPVVTVMGHVDHGKTTLLDFIRNTNVVSGEAGGITQHIGAYQATVDGRPITFIDTPGHAAFTAMRARGSRVTDIVILVVAADDGVMPQTVEASTHAKAANVPIVVAVNKIDREDADPERIRHALAGHEIVPEEWGGENMFVDVSALTGQGIDNLLDAISLQAEVLELSAPEEGPARGVVVESRIERGRGPVATVLVQSGRLAKGDILLAGQEFGRVRGLFDEAGAETPSAGPSTPVEVLGLSGPPDAGDEAVVVADERKAREIATFRHGKHREVRLARQQSAKLENVFEQMKEGATHTLNIIVKADVQGSVEALRDALTQLSTDEVKVNVVTAAAGGISETDANLAVASNAIIIGFNVRADAAARRVIEAEMVDLRYFSVIYDVIDTVEQAMSGMLAPEFREEIIGIAEVRDIFRSKRFGNIAGCRVSEGTVRRSNPIRVLRDSVVIYEGELESLRRFQDDVNEVRAGTECGIGVRNYNDVKVGDQIEVYERIQLQRTL
jgi:translation initiation factor IF-2